ncbi:MAG TPA: hypothetical protein VLZ74_00605 [Methylocella sp.]|nr:hypothetical protein [Methylocella sp.]
MYDSGIGLLHRGFSWGPRQETPEELAARWLKLIVRLQAIDPIFAHWYISTTWTDADPSMVPFDTQIAPLAEKIAANVITSDSGEPEPRLGYQLFAHNTEKMGRGPRNFEAPMYAGGLMRWTPNMIGIGTDYGVVPDVVTYKIFRGALLALAETFEATIGLACPSGLMDLSPKDPKSQRGLKLAWINEHGDEILPSGKDF